VRSLSALLRALSLSVHAEHGGAPLVAIAGRQSRARGHPPFPLAAPRAASMPRTRMVGPYRLIPRESPASICASVSPPWLSTELRAAAVVALPPASLHQTDSAIAFPATRRPRCAAFLGREPPAACYRRGTDHRSRPPPWPGGHGPPHPELRPSSGEPRCAGARAALSRRSRASNLLCRRREVEESLRLPLSQCLSV
jgi:hypothetical protein